MKHHTWSKGMIHSSLLVLLSVSLLLFVSSTLAARHTTSVDDIAISNVNLLLPLTLGKVKASYVIEAYNGCFTWVSTNREVVTIEPMYEEAQSGNCNTNPFEGFQEEKCSKKARITVHQNTLDRRSSSMIIAEDLVSGRKARCEVYVDAIQKIVIETTTRRMYHDDVEELYVQAYDSVGNLFSTLEGLQFQWSIVAANPSATPPLKYVSFADSTIEASDTLLQMEREGKESYTVLVQGVESGKVHVTARLIELGYSDVKQHSVLISVLEPLALEPLHPVYIAPGTTILYELQTYKNEYTRTIRMPNPQYEWSSSNATVASVANTGLVEALQLGKTEIKVQYEDMAENHARADVNVVWPTHLALKIVPLTEDGTQRSNVAASSTNWYLVLGRQYSLTVEVYDTHSHRIHTNDDWKFVLDLPTHYFTPLDHSSNYAQSSLACKAEGLTEISATLRALVNSRTKQIIPLPAPLIVRQEVVVSSPVQVLPSVVRLPWDPVARHSYPLVATGGSREYNWFSSDNSISTVSSRGVVTTATAGVLGLAHVMAVDNQNPSNRAPAYVHVSPVSRVQFVPLQRELPVGQSLLVALSAFDSEGHKFDNCSTLPYQWTISHDDIFTLTEEDPHDVLHTRRVRELVPTAFHPTLDTQNPCAYRRLRALRAGQITLTVHYNQTNKAELTLFAYEPLRVHPADALVTVGSSHTFQATGGPSPWFYEPGAFQARMIHPRTSGEAVRVDPVVRMPFDRTSTHPQVSSLAFTVTCLQLGDHALTIQVSNQATPTNLHPAQASFDVLLRCHHPTSVFLYPLAPSLPADKLSSRCGESFFIPEWDQAKNSFAPLTAAHLAARKDQQQTGEGAASSQSLTQHPGEWPSTYSVRNNQTFALQLIVADSEGVLFNNFTSVHFQWTLDTSGTNEPGVARILPNRNPLFTDHVHLELGLRGHSQTVRITAQALDYHPQVLSRARVYQHYALPHKQNLHKQLSLRLYSNVELLPAHKSLFLNPKNQLSLQIVGGSGIVQLASNDSSLISLQAHGHDHTRVLVTPLRAGTVSVQAIDSCLRGSHPGQSLVFISPISHIVLHVDSNQLLIGKQATLTVYVYDIQQQLFDPSQFVWMNLRPQLDCRNPNLCAIELTPVPNQPDKYIVHGRLEGATRVSFSSSTTSGTGADQVVSSPSLLVHVYPAFAISPHQLILLPGNSFQVQASGGPPSGATVVYTSSQDKIATVDPQGVVVARAIGSCIIYATSEARFGQDGRTAGSQRAPATAATVYGEDSIKVIVKSLSDIHIEASTNKLLVGTETNVYIAGRNGETPFSYHSPYLTYHWWSSNSDVLQLAGHYEASGALLSEENAFSVRLKANKVGQARIQVEMASSSSSVSVLPRLTASLSFTVLDKLTLLSPATLLLSPYAEYTIRTSLDYTGQLTYSILETSCAPTSSTLLAICSVNKQGVIQTQARTGLCYVSVVERATGQTVSLVVEVKPIYKAQFKLLSSEHYPARLTLAVGESLEFAILYSDELSRPFDQISDHSTLLSSSSSAHPDVTINENGNSANSNANTATNSNSHSNSNSNSGTTTTTDNNLSTVGAKSALDTMLSFFTDRQEIISIRKQLSNDTIIVTALKPGEIILKSSYHPNQVASAVLLDDYIRVRVENAIWPASPVVHRGGHIHFDSQYPITTTTTAGSSSGARVWQSSDPTVLAIDATTGKATALQAGRVLVTRSDSTSVSSTTVRVVEIDHIDIEPPANGYISNHQQAPQVVLLPVHFYYGADSPVQTALNVSAVNPSHQIEFQCMVDEASAPWIKAAAVYPQGTSLGSAACSLRFSRSSPANRDVFPDAIVVSVVASNTRLSPAFQFSASRSIPFYPEFTLDRELPLVLTSGQAHAQLKVRHGLSEPVVSSSNSSLVTIRKSSRHLDTSVYDISVADPRLAFQEEIVVFFPLTNQRHVLDVSFSPTDDHVYVHTHAPAGDSPFNQHVPTREVLEVTTQSSSSLLYYVMLSLITLSALILGCCLCNNSSALGSGVHRAIPVSPAPSSASPKQGKTDLARSVSSRVAQTRFNPTTPFQFPHTVTVPNTG